MDTESRAVKVTADPITIPPDIIGKTLLSAASTMVRPAALFHENKSLEDIIGEFNLFFNSTNKRWKGKNKYIK